MCVSVSVCVSVCRCGVCGLGEGTEQPPPACYGGSEQLFWVVWFRGLELLKAKGRHRSSGVSAEVNLLKGNPRAPLYVPTSVAQQKEEPCFLFHGFGVFSLQLRVFFLNVTLCFLENSFF